MNGLMIWGTNSDAGKSFIATGLCRALAKRGYRVAPFKAQNMSNNSYVTISGHEIGRSQGVQAEAAGVIPDVHMNPVLLKPQSDRHAEVIIQGISKGSPAAKRYRDHFFTEAREAMKESLTELNRRYDFIVMEGAGSPAEINLMDKDLANLETAQFANVPALLVADIERGGVFASLVGTLSLLPSIHQQRVIGTVVNRFRGDPALFQQGKTWLETKTGVPVQGVLPMLDVPVENEDSLGLKHLALKGQEGRSNQALDVAVIALSYISNFTDIEPLLSESDVHVRLVKHAEEVGEPDIMILPGTRSTIHDLKELKKRGMDEKIKHYVKQGGHVLALCGGYQMLGIELVDSAGTDTGTVGLKEEGLHLFPQRTFFQATKTTKRWQGKTANPYRFFVMKGFEIHTGKTEYAGEYTPFLLSDRGEEEGIINHDGRVIGTYLHHLLYNDEWRNHWLNEVRKRCHLPAQPVVYYTEKRNAAFDELADAMEEHLNIDQLLIQLEQVKS